MRRTICSMVVAVATVLGVFAHDIISIEKKGDVTIEHIEHCYLITQHQDGSTYVIRYKRLDEQYHDTYVIEICSGVYEGYESDGNYRIIAKRTTNIAVKSY